MNIRKLFYLIILALTLFQTGCNSNNSTPVHSGEWANIEQLIMEKVNNHRTSLASPLAKLQVDPKLTEQARIHSTNMATGKTSYGHDWFTNRVAAAGYGNYAAGENVHRTGSNASTDPEYLANYAVNGWLNSSGHRQNIEGNYNLSGVGIAKSSSGEYFFTQIFVKK
ncbi:MAG TPA: CAP domain-containing protein [Bacillota bacterium]|nr:CAP domain-containing protein [Bacillota bacterium]